MTTYIALLRAVNVGGTGRVVMKDLKALAVAAGCTNVRTYISSGNLVFESEESERAVKARLEAGLRTSTGKPTAVAIRTAAELFRILSDNPFPDAAPQFTVAVFLEDPPPSDSLDAQTGRTTERVALGVREIYIDYGKGMARSRLTIPIAKTETARNMNTVQKLAKLASGA